VKSLVELHGGVVSASSPGEGQGSVFTIQLPISAVRHEYIQPPSPKPSLASLGRPELAGVRILIVDDEPDTCDMLRFIFNETGSIVETTGSAPDALQVFDRWKPDILIADIGMPDMDGYELIQLIRKERGSRIPAIALTAQARIEDRIKALNAGYQMHVSKPVEPAELMSIAASLVGLINRNAQ
jgi:CheY-like chemotaxis protein